VKKLLSVFLVLSIVFSLMPASIFANNEEISSIEVLYVGGVDALVTPEGEGWSYDAATGVLTLNNCTLTENSIQTNEYGSKDALIYFRGSLTIELIGDNYLERVIEEAPTDYTQYYAICADVSENSEYEDYFAILGTGSLTAGVAISEDMMDPESYGNNWEYFEYSCGILCLAEGGVDLTGLHSGGYVDVYGGIINYPGSSYANAFNTSPTFGSNQTVIAYQDVEGTMENEYGYNWNNNDAWRMKVLTVDAYLNSSGMLTLNDKGSASGEGWIWEDCVLTLSPETEVKCVLFKRNLESVKLNILGDVTLNGTGLYSSYNYARAIEAYCDIEIDAGDYTLTLIGEDHVIAVDRGDLLISGGTLNITSEYGDAIYTSASSVTIRDTIFNSDYDICLEDGYDDDYNTLYSGECVIENSVLNLNAYIDCNSVLEINNSELNMANGFYQVCGAQGITVRNSNLNINARGAALYSPGTIVIEKSNLDLYGGETAIIAGEVYGNDAVVNMESLILTDVNVITPETWSFGITRDGSFKYLTIYDSYGEMATTVKMEALETDNELTLKDTEGKYSITEEYVNGVVNETTVDNILSLFNNSENIYISKNGNVITGNTFVGTGCVVYCVNADGEICDQKTIIVKGDINGDGLIKASDYMQTKQAILNPDLMTDAKLKAADINGDGLIKATDYMKIKLHITGSLDIYA